MPKIVRLLCAAALILGGLVAVQVVKAPPAAAYIAGCSGHQTQAVHTTTPGGNVYRLEGHVCIDIGPQSGNSLAVNTRWHGHCTRNGVAWDGCRVNTQLVVEFFVSGSGWQDDGSTDFDITEPNSGYFANSQTRVSFAAYFADEIHVRGKAEDPDNMRFLLADGTTVLKDMADAPGIDVEICTVDPC